MFKGTSKKLILAEEFTTGYKDLMNRDFLNIQKVQQQINFTPNRISTNKEPNEYRSLGLPIVLE